MALIAQSDYPLTMFHSEQILQTKQQLNIAEHLWGQRETFCVASKAKCHIGMESSVHLSECPTVRLSVSPSVCHALLLLAPHVFLDYHAFDKIVGILLDKSWSHDAMKMTILGSATFVWGDHVLLTLTIQDSRQEKQPTLQCHVLWRYISSDLQMSCY